MTEQVSKLNREFKTKYKAFFIAAGVIIIALAVVINVVAGLLEEGFNLKADLTETRYYTLSDESINVMDNLDTDIQIFTLFKTGDEDMVITEVLNKYSSYSPNVELTNVDPTKQPGFTSPFDPNKKGINSGSVIITDAEKSRYKVLSFFDLYQVQYTKQGDFYITGLKAEQSVSSAINYIQTGVIPRIMFLSGHGEATTISAYANTLTSSGYEIAQYAIFEHDEPLDPINDTLMIISPKQDLTDDEYEVIEDFLAKGGNAMFFMDSVVYNAAKNEMHLLPDPLENFNSLLMLYDVRVNKDLVVGETASAMYQKETNLLPNVFQHKITAPMIQANRSPIISDASSITIPEKPSDVINTVPLLFTVNETYAKDVDNNLTSLSKVETDKQGPFVLAALSEKGDSSIIVFSTSAIVANDTEYNLLGNRDLLTSSVAYLNQREESIAITPKSMAGNVLQLQSESQRFILIVLVIGIIPLAILAIGFVVRSKRKRS